MAMVSRNMPPRAAMITIIPAEGGPSSTTVHSSGVKADLSVIHLMMTAMAPGRRPPPGHLPPSGGRPAPELGLRIRSTVDVPGGPPVKIDSDPVDTEMCTSIWRDRLNGSSATA